jgi:hypothetical protein
VNVGRGLKSIRSVKKPSQDGFLDVDLTNNGGTLDAHCANDRAFTEQLTVSKSNKDYQISKKIEPGMQKIGVTTSYRIVSL